MMFPVSRTHLLWKMGALVICMTNCIIVVCVIDDLIIYICKKKIVRRENHCSTTRSHCDCASPHGIHPTRMCATRTMKLI